MNTTPDSEIMDCACVIHGTAYDWIYVERLYNMLCRNSQREICLHVYTEPDRFVPSRMFKHPLIDWPGLSGPKKSWWYKMQLFNSEHHCGPLLYFDLDVVITKNIDWIWDLDTEYFWAIDDFRRIFRPGRQGINSSIMYWDTSRWNHIWQDFQILDLKTVVKTHHGDQDYLNLVIPVGQRKFLDVNRIKSWRWQIKDGGINARTRTYYSPGAGTVLDPHTCVMIFHGDPKPHQITDSVIDSYWGKII